MHLLLRNTRNLLGAGGLFLALSGTAQGQPTLRRVYPTTAAFAHDSLLTLGSAITLEVSDLRVGAGSRFMARDLTLYLNGIPLRGLAPLAVYTLPAAPAPAASHIAPALVVAGTDSTRTDNEPAATAQVRPAIPSDSSAQAAHTLTKVVFALRRDMAPHYWALADGPPWQTAHSVQFGLGLDNHLFAQPQAGRVGIVQLASAQGWLVGLVLAGLAGILLLVAAARSWLLRTPPAEATDADGYPLTVAEAAPPYSLGRVQLAWWGFLVLGGGLVSGGVTGTLPILPVATLALLGVSVGTALLAGLSSARPGREPFSPRQSRGWLADLLCDERGLAIYRLQFVLASLAIGGGLVWTVYTTGVLPAWPLGTAWLLAFSGVAYLSPKWQQFFSVRAASPAAVPVPPAPAWPAYAEPQAPATSNRPSSAPVLMGWPTQAAEATPAYPAPLGVPKLSDSPAPAVWLHPTALPAELVSVPGPPLAPTPTPEPAVLPTVAAPFAAVDALATQSLADPETGHVLYHEEDDMGPLEDDMITLEEDDVEALEEDGTEPLTKDEYSSWPVGG